MTATLPSLRTTTFAALLAFALALAVFAATRGDAPSRPGCRRPAAAPDRRSPSCRPRSAPDGRQRDGARRPRTSRRRARPATSASRPAPSGCSTARCAATRATPAPSSSRARSPRRATTSAPRCGWPAARGRSPRTRSRRGPLLVDALVELGRFGAAERDAAALRRPAPGPPRLRARLVPARAARRSRRRRARDGAGRRGRRRRARERRRRAGAARRPRARPRPTACRAARDSATALAGVPGYVPALAGAGAAGRGPRRPAPARSPRCAASSGGCRCPST